MDTIKINAVPRYERGAGSQGYPFRGFELVASGGTKPVGKDAVALARECQELGAGAILLTSMDGDGTKAGYDLEFTRAICGVVNVPVVASGGVGKLEHFHEAVVQGGAGFYWPPQSFTIVS